MQCTGDLKAHHTGRKCGWWLGCGESIRVGTAFAARARRSMLREHADTTAAFHRCGGSEDPFDLADVGCWVDRHTRGVGLEHTRLDPFEADSPIDDGGIRLWSLRGRGRCDIEIVERGCAESEAVAAAQRREDLDSMEIWDRR